MLVEAYDLSKKYGDKWACSDICLSLTEGQVFGLLGPNGAGKSTLVKMLLGLVYPTSGQAYIQGQSVQKPKTRKIIGYLPELFRLYDWLSAHDLLHFYARFYGIPVRDEKAAIAEVLELVGLKGREKERIQGYSKGMQQRLGLAGAIIHRPALLFLDEPSSALDPIGRREVRDIISILKARGTTIFLNSHLLGEVEMTCSHLGFIKQGKLFSSGKIEDFMQSSHEIAVEAANIPDHQVREWQAQGKILERYENQVLMKVGNREEIPGIIALLVAQGADIFSVNSRNKGLEEVFLDLMEN